MPCSATPRGSLSRISRLTRLKDAMYDISNMLDDFEADTDLLAATMKKIKMPHKMKEMQERLQKISEDRKNYSIHPETRSHEQQVPDMRETAGKVKEAEIIGRTKEKQEILARLSGSTTEETTFLPIWGFGGIGKTTMARFVFNHSQFKEYSRVWVYVSQIFDLNFFGNSIISQLSENKEQSKIDDLQIIHNSLEKLFADNKKILIILDDLWEKRPSQLEELKAMLKQGGTSKVLVVVTTREESIAQEIGTVGPFELPPLSDQICWDIIKEKSKFETRHDKERLELTGKEIAKMCGGVPLAAQSLGHMLKTKTYDVWDSVRTNHIWKLSTSKDTSHTDEVLASLLLSYNFMPPYLKLCFAYCAIFPKGHYMIKDDLIHQWIALGFIEPSSIFSTWQLSQSYVRQLLGMSFLQHSKDYATRFIMHDLVHDLARSVMADEFNLEGPNCRYEWRTGCKKPLKSSTTSTAKLRALHIGDHAYKEIQFHRDAAKYIHVLDLCTNYLHELPDSIGQLKQLRYLSAPNVRCPMNPRCISMLSKLNYLNLHYCNDLSALPESIGKLEGLMHLDLSECKNLKELPLSFGKLRELLYLDLSHCDGLLGIPKALCGLTKLQHLDLSACENLGGLPEVIRKLTELRYLNLSWCMHHIFDCSSTDQAESFIHCICMFPNMEQLNLSCSECPLSIPESASRLRKLVLRGCNQVTRIPECVAKMDSRSLFGLLPSFSVYSDGTESNSNLDLLEHINPEQLSINMLGNVKFLEEADIINLSEKQSIGKLRLRWTEHEHAKRSVEDMELLRELVPPITLQGFKINGYNSVSFPDWLMSIGNYLPNLVRIKMSHLPNCKSLPPLAHLPNLRVLRLTCMESLEEWNTTYSTGEDSVNELMFPKPEEVHIYCCPKLRIKPHLPRAASWNIHSSDNVLISWGESVSHSSASSSSRVSTKLSVRYSEVPLHQWSLLHHLPARSDLYIYDCSELTSSPEITRALHSIKSLKLDNSGHAEQLEWLGELTSL